MSSRHKPDRPGTGNRAFSVQEDPPQLISGKDPLRETYQGHWKDLSLLHKVGVALSLSVGSFFAVNFVVLPFLHAEFRSNLFKGGLAVGGFAICLLAFGWALQWLVRWKVTHWPSARNR